MGWKVVASGSNVDTLTLLGKNYQLQAGQRMRVEFDVPGFAWAFDIAPNWGFPTPAGLHVVDVWGEGSGTGMVELEANTPPLAAVVAWIGVNWLRLVIAGVVLYVVVRAVKIWLDVTEEVGNQLASALKWALPAGFALLAVVVLSKQRSTG